MDSLNKKKAKFSIKDFFSKREQIGKKIANIY